MYKLSVIIPFKDGKAYISRFLEGVSSQSLDKENYELIFVSNNTTDSSLEEIRTYCKKIKNAYVYVFNEKKGSYAARNYGIIKAKNEILVFIDIDCKMTSEFLIKLYDLFNNKNINAVAGKITLEINDISNEWEIYDFYANLNNERMLQKNRVATANFSIRKDIVNVIGMFSEFISSGDSEFGERLASNNIKIVYEPNIEVLHPTRKNYESIKNKLTRIAYGEGQRANKEEKLRYKYIIIYFLKAINIVNLIRLWKKMKKHIKFHCFLIFAFRFTGIRMKQIVSFQRGYLDTDSAKYNL